VTQPRDRAEVAEKLAVLIELARGFGMWGVELRATGELIGRCGFYPWAPNAGAPQPELTYLLARPHWSMGLASEAASAALASLRVRCDPERVVALVRPEHAASRRVLEKLGMREAEHTVVSGVGVLLYALARR
jgi:[ribosomal protein S5]-alanine N-acetyltransferase